MKMNPFAPARSLNNAFMFVSIVTTAAAVWDWIQSLSWSEALLNQMLMSCGNRLKQMLKAFSLVVSP